MQYTDKELSKMIDHSLLHPTMTDDQLKEGCELAVQYDVASVCIKPYAIPLAVPILESSDVKVGSVVGFPHGTNMTEIKRLETESACKEGAQEIDIVINTGKVFSKDWAYVEKEIAILCDEVHKHHAKIKVIFENDFLPDDAIKIKLCQICSKIGVDWVKTSTGYGFVKDSTGLYSYKGATEHDLRLMRKYCSSEVQIKAAGGVRDLDGLIKVRDLGASRCGATATKQMLDEFNRRISTKQNSDLSSETTGTIGQGGY